MRAVAILSELQAVGVLVTATPDGDLDLDAPRGVLTEERLTALRQHKAEIVRLLSSHCPFCGYLGDRQEQSIKEELLYADRFCGECGELIECFVPGQHKDAADLGSVA